MKLTKVLIAASILSSLASYPIYAADDFNPDNYLTGDMFGWRSKLHDAGVDLSLSYEFETGGNFTGGDDHGYSYADQTALGMVFDLGKLIGLDDGSFHFTLANRGGQARNINDKAGIHDGMQSLEVYGRGRTTRITQFYYEQHFLDDVLEMKLGRMSFGDEFGGDECEFMYLGLCGSQPGNYNSTIYNWPISQWAANLKYNFVSDWYMKIGITQNNEGWLSNHQGWNFGNPSGTHGVTIPLEFGWTPDFADHPGTYKVGVWYDTKGGDDIARNRDHSYIDDASNDPHQHTNKSGFYLMARQQVVNFGNDSSRGMQVFFYTTKNDKDISTIDRSVAAGVTFKGPFAIRPKDKWSVGVDYLHFSSRLADRQEANNEHVGTDEWAFATYYKVQVTGWASIQPEIQYLSHPGGSSRNSNAWVAALKGNISF